MVWRIQKGKATVRVGHFLPHKKRGVKVQNHSETEGSTFQFFGTLRLSPFFGCVRISSEHFLMSPKISEVIGVLLKSVFRARKASLKGFETFFEFIMKTSCAYFKTALF